MLGFKISKAPSPNVRPETERWPSFCYYLHKGQALIHRRKRQKSANGLLELVEKVK